MKRVMILKIVEIPIPRESQIGSYLPDADFADAYEVFVSRNDQKIEDSYHAVMSSMPGWFRNLFKLRNVIVRPLGLEAPQLAEIDNIAMETTYEVGDKIGVFSFYGRSDNELIAGGDDKHLDFRLSILRTMGEKMDRITVSTLVKTHNIFGKFYLQAILPFHKLGVKALLRNAAEAGKL